MNTKHQSLVFRKLSLGRGIYQLVCWSDETVCPCGLVFFQVQTNGKNGVDCRTRIDILQIYVPTWAQRQGIGGAMLNKLKDDSDVVHTSMHTDAHMTAFLKKYGFMYAEESMDWCWTRTRATPFEGCPATDAVLASLLGWTSIKKDGQNNFFGLPPNASGSQDEKKLLMIPSWSTDRALALALLIEVSDKHGFDHRWWKLGGNYRVGVRTEESSADFSDDQCGLWYSALPIAIVDAMIRFLRSSRHKSQSEDE